jgi:hypothetical protein
VHRVLLAVLLTAVAAPCVSARDALQAIDDCVARLDTSVDIGYTQIAQRCPELTPALKQSPFAAWLPRHWDQAGNQQLSAQGLSELRILLARASEVHPARDAVPATQHLAGILAAITRPAESQASWWTRFKEWLHRVMSGQSQDDEGWLVRWWRGLALSDTSTNLITWSCLAVLVALALGVGVNELRLAGVLGRRPARAASTGGSSGSTHGPAGPIGTVAPREQPAQLLELIAAHLFARGLLPPARGLTARELVRRARLPDQAGRANLTQLVAVCERIRFADEDVEEGIRERALREGRALLMAIDALPVPVAQA